jgi:hypothetical protein
LGAKGLRNSVEWVTSCPTTEEGVQFLKDVSSRILHISLNEDQARIEEADLIEENRENQNIFK